MVLFYTLILDLWIQPLRFTIHAKTGNQFFADTDPNVGTNSFV